MFLYGKYRLPLAWTLLFAVLLNIAAPPFAAAREPASRYGLGEICSASHKKPAASGADQKSGKHANSLHDGHCQLCSLRLAAGLPALPAVLPVAAGCSGHAPQRQLATAVVRPDCPSPPSQAPPAIS